MSDLVSTSGALPKERRSDGSGILITVLALAAVLAIKLLWIKTSVFDAMSTDDTMRLVEVRDLLNGQGWLDLMQYRLDPPGVLMHWSRIIDAPLAMFVALLKPLIGTHDAEAVTLFVWPLLLFAAAVALVVTIARQMSNGSVAAQIAAAVLTLLAVPALVHFRPGAIDHHNAQIDLLLALTLFTLQIERSTFKAALAGFMAALSLAIGVEMLPVIAAISIAVVGLFIWRGAPVRRQVLAFAIALAASSLVLALALLPLPGLVAPVFDSLGGPLLLLTVGGGVGLTAMVGIDRYHTALWLRVATATASAIALIGAMVWLFAGHIASPYGQLDPIVVSLWLDKVQETISLATMLRLGPEEVLGFYAFPLIALGIAAAALVRSKPSERFRWVVGIAALAPLFAISVWEMRGTGGAAVAAAPLFAAGAAIVWPSLAIGRNLAVLAFVVSPAMFATIGPPMAPLIYLIFPPEQMDLAPEASRCQNPSDVASLKQLPKGRVMAPIDLGPAILVETNHDVFGAPYHRNNDGNLAMLKLMLARPSVAHEMISDRHVDYVVICQTDPNRSIIERAPDGLEATLARGEAPDFLERIDAASAGKITTWRVRK
ncbi:hypothetical protein [Bradyrhizobium sp.]|uniref:hypothetical protein n=1 Tax=Bradyrhizobium sp. TaxID=376 RepID=UPI002D60B0AE|nr:hypothetical protein [Bradyrhizobium sp.]HZR77053.1 hypothetical protein [Bradyrhizobium sp.]